MSCDEIGDQPHNSNVMNGKKTVKKVETDSDSSDDGFKKENED